MNALELGSARKRSSEYFFDDLYADYRIQRLTIFRSICSIAEKRATVKQLLITNY